MIWQRAMRQQPPGPASSTPFRWRQRSSGSVGKERHPAHLHAHFAHDPALVALLVKRLTRLPYSFTAHARDLVQIPPSSLAARAAEATALVTCCEANAEYIASTVPTSVPAVRVIHHGVELDLFKPQPRPTLSRGGTAGHRRASRGEEGLS